MRATRAITIVLALCLTATGVVNGQSFFDCPSCTARLDVTLRKSTYEVGEPIVLQVRITNTGGVPLPVPVSSDVTGRHDGYRFTVTDAGGRAVGDPFAGGIAGLNAIISPRTVEPGAVSTRELVLNYFMAPLEPGRYVLRSVWELTWKSQTRAEATATSFEIVPTSPAQRGRRLIQLTTALGRGDDPRRVAPLLGFTGDPNARDPLIDLLYSHDDGVCVAAADALSLLDAGHVMRGLLDAIKTRGPRARVMDIVMGSTIVDRVQAIDRLTPWIRSSNQDARAAALRGVGFFNEPPRPELFSLLAAMLKDAVPAVRHQAAVAVGVYADANALEALRPAVRDSDPDVREQATIAVGWVADARPAGDAVRARAIELLQEIARTRGPESQQAFYWLSKVGASK